MVTQQAVIATRKQLENQTKDFVIKVPKCQRKLNSELRQLSYVNSML